MMRVIAILFLFALIACSQNLERKGGVVFDSPEAIDKVPEMRNAFLRGEALHTQDSIKMPPVGNQGGESSCVAFAVGYAARSAEQFYSALTYWYNINRNVFSPEYIYDLCKFGDCNAGTSVQTVLDTLVKRGVCIYNTMPYSSTNGCSLQPTQAQDYQASFFRIKGYSKIACTDRATIKTMIATKHPVIIVVIADNSFLNAKPGFIWKAYSGSGFLPHCLVICAYDDSKNAYKIMNSWGTSWGDAGFSWIDYDFFERGGRSSYWTYVMNL